MKSLKALRNEPIIHLMKCLETPKTIRALWECAKPYYKTQKYMMLDLYLLIGLGLAHSTWGAEHRYVLTEKGREALKEVLKG